MTDPSRHDATLHVRTEPNRRHTRAPSGEEYDVRVVASTAGLARDGGLIPPSAWDWSNGLSRFKKNPVILWAHQHHEVAVGRSVHTEVVGDGLVEYWKFHEETELSRVLKKLYSDGEMRGVSVGFIVHDTTDPNTPEGRAVAKAAGVDPQDVAWIATKAELLETSAVNVGSDPEALTDAARSALADVSLSSDDRKDDTLTIPIREGESREDALRRYVDEILRARIGSPVGASGGGSPSTPGPSRLKLRVPKGGHQRPRVDPHWHYNGNRGPGR